MSQTVSPSQLESTNDAIFSIGRFLFHENSIIVWVHLVILLIGAATVLWAASLDGEKISPGFPCRNLAKDMLSSVKLGASGFLTSFAIGFLMFVIAIGLDGSSVPSMITQVLTYMPTIVLALAQLVAAISGLRVLKRHIGL